MALTVGQFSFKLRLMINRRKVIIVVLRVVLNDNLKLKAQINLLIFFNKQLTAKN